MNATGIQEQIAPDEDRLIEDFMTFMKTASFARHPDGAVRRFNQGRASGCVDAEFTVLEALPAELAVGLFAKPRTFRARIRFANASSATDRDKDIRGMSIRLHDVPGPNLTEGSTVHDFVLNSHPVMPAADTREFLALMKAMEAGGLQRALYLLSNPKAALIGARARQQPSCHLDIPYWSTTPYLFGPNRAVKYVTRPVSPFKSTRPTELSDTYLRDALRAHLAREEALFDFAVQFQIGKMPIEDATAEWSELESPYRSVARIRIPSQAVSDEQANGCEGMSFNPWYCHAEHRPIGSMNRARRVIYTEMARFRAAENARRGV